MPDAAQEEPALDAARQDAQPALDATRAALAGRLSCQLCVDDRPRGPRLYVWNGSDKTCTVLHLVWDSDCDGLDIGAGDLCLEKAELWPDADTCPPTDAGVPFLARSAEGSVVGHEGIIGIDVQLSFPEDAAPSRVAVDFDQCRADYEELKPPCP